MSCVALHHFRSSVHFSLASFAFVIDPLFALAFLVSSSAPSVLDGIFQATFLCALLLFWLCIYHSIRQVRLVTFISIWYISRYARYAIDIWITAFKKYFLPTVHSQYTI